MILLQETFLSDSHQCPYLEDQSARYEYFFAIDVKGDELERLLETGWRKFGAYFFRPNCSGCRRCVPLRVVVADFVPSKSQRRVQRRAAAAGVSVTFGPLSYSDRIFEIYADHSLVRFGRQADRDEFISTFYTRSCPSLQSEYYLGDRLVAAGFLDRGNRSLSSVYFVYDTGFDHLRLGTLSIMREIALAREMGLDHYYLGYWIGDNRSMAYKERFYPQERYDWTGGGWKRRERGSE
jgi:arginine-tRNA-protein transferase